MDDVLVLWDIDGTLIDAGGVGRDLYNLVFQQLFERSLPACAPMAGRTDRAIILDTLTLAGVSEPRRYVDPFIAGLGEHARSMESAVAQRGQALPGAAEVLATLAAARYLAGFRGGGPGGDLVGALRGPGGRGGGVMTAVAAAPVAVATIPGLVTVPDPGPVDKRGVRSASAADGRVYQSVLTGNIRALAQVKLTALGLRDGLDLCIGAYGDDHEDRTELVHVARRRAAGVHGASGTAFAGTAFAGTAFAGTATVVIGDTPLDIAAALAADARAIGVATGSYPAADLTAAGAHAVLPSLADTALVLDAIFG